MKKVFLVVALMATWASTAAAFLSSVQIEPPAPEVGETVFITVTGYMPDSCWSLVGHDCLDPVEQGLVVEINTYDCAGRECENCLAVLIPFAVECTYEYAEPGIYDVRVVEHWDSLHPIFVPDLNTSFEVFDSVATTKTTWSAVKALYR